MESAFQELGRTENSLAKSENTTADFKLKKEIYKQRTEEISGKISDLQAENEELRMSRNNINKEYQLLKTQCLNYKEELDELYNKTNEESNRLNKTITQYKTKDQVIKNKLPSYSSSLPLTPLLLPPHPSPLPPKPPQQIQNYVNHVNLKNFQPRIQEPKQPFSTKNSSHYAKTSSSKTRKPRLSN